MSAGNYVRTLENIVVKRTKRITELESSIVELENQWVSVDVTEPENNKMYWHCYNMGKTYTAVLRGYYSQTFKKMIHESNLSYAFTHYAESVVPAPPKEQGE